MGNASFLNSRTPSASGDGIHRRRARPATRAVSALFVALAALTALPAAQAAAAASRTAAPQSAAMAHPSRALWVDVQGTPASARGANVAVRATRYRAAMLDRSSLQALAATAPMERTQAERQNPLIVSLPDPDGGFQRFALAESPIMEPGLAAKHPEIKTYAGRGIDDPKATIRADMSPLGFHASVRSSKGSWYIDPYYHLDDSLYASYYRRDVPKLGALTEAVLSEPQLALSRGLYHAADTVQVRGVGFTPGALVAITVRNAKTDVAPRQVVHATATADGTVSATIKADPYKNLGTYSITATEGRSSAGTTYQVVSDATSLDASVGPVLRTYRLALLTDPAYATYFGGSANVTAAKVALINRVTQIYESEISIRLVLIANNDVLNLDTAAQFSNPNGPCGGTACFPTASVSCASATLTRNRQVIGLLVGASNFDIGHIGVGAGGGGIASLGVVGGNNKAQGCTGLPTPVGDLFAVDYVAHEMGHQFAGNHTFNGITGSCSGGNRSAANSVEPGSGTSIMAYAGICGTDNTQPHSDAYWSQRSFDEITTYTSAAETNINEVQQAALTNYVTDGLQFLLRYNGADSAPIVRGSNFTVAGIKAAVEAIPGWPAGGTVTVSTLTDTGFTITFGGALAGINASELQLLGCTGGCTGYVGEIAKGGLTTRGGQFTTPTGNSAPVLAAVPSYTIPIRTPFALTANATDADAGDTVTYMWEQNDRGGSTGTGLTSNTKTNGPLFRQFGTYANVTAAGTLQYNSPGENIVGTSPTRVFPDLVQILANNTNAETGACPTASATPTIPQIDCFSEFLPTADYVGFAGVNASPARLNFKVTARDGRGGVNSTATVLTLEPTAGPFLVTAPNTAVTLDSRSNTTVTWNVANTSAAPVGTANVKITLSVDGGLTYPYVLAESTANDGSEVVALPNLGTTRGRIKVEAVGNVFFDVSNADFTIRLLGDVNGDGAVDCADLAIVKASIGKLPGQPGYDPRADVTGDGVVNIKDLAYVSQRVTVGTRCPVSTEL
jgi:trimeric autotransporter adhesin